MHAKVSELATFYSGFFFHEVHIHLYIVIRAENKTEILANDVSIQNIKTIYIGVDVQYFFEPS
jgi:hypothetical protein